MQSKLMLTLSGCCYLDNFENVPVLDITDYVHCSRVAIGDLLKELLPTPRRAR